MLRQTKQTYHAVDRHELISTFQVAVSVGNTARNYTRYVDWGILLLAAHYVEPETLSCLRQLHYSGMRMTFTCCKCCNCCLAQSKHILCIFFSFTTLLDLVQSSNFPSQSWIEWAWCPTNVITVLVNYHLWHSLCLSLYLIGIIFRNYSGQVMLVSQKFPQSRKFDSALAINREQLLMQNNHLSGHIIPMFQYVG